MHTSLKIWTHIWVFPPETISFSFVFHSHESATFLLVSINGLLLLWDRDPTTCVQTNIWYLRHLGLTGCTLPAFSSVGGSLQEHTTTDWPSGWTWATWGSSATLLSLEYMLCAPCPWWESFQVYSLERVRCCWDYLDA